MDEVDRKVHRLRKMSKYQSQPETPRRHRLLIPLLALLTVVACFGVYIIFVKAVMRGYRDEQASFVANDQALMPEIVPLEDRPREEQARVWAQRLRSSDRREVSAAINASRELLPRFAVDIVPGMIAALESSDAATCAAIADLLGQLGPSAYDAIPALIQLAKRGSRLGLIAELALVRIDFESLDQLHDDPIPTLIRCLKVDDESVRRAALIGLAMAERGADRALPAIAELVDEDSSTSSSSFRDAPRSLTIWAFGAIVERDASRMSAERRQFAARTLNEMAYGGDDNIRLNAVWGLQAVAAEEDARQALQRCLAGSFGRNPSSSVTSSVARFALLRDPSNLAKAVADLTDAHADFSGANPRAQVNAWAVHDVLVAGGQSAVEPLMSALQKLLDERNVPAAQQTGEAGAGAAGRTGNLDKRCEGLLVTIGEIGPAAAAARERIAALRTDPALGPRAEETLKLIDAARIDQMIRLIRTRIDHAAVRDSSGQTTAMVAIVLELARCGQQAVGAVPALRTLLDSEDAHLRTAAAYALQRVEGTDDAIRQRLAALSESKPSVPSSVAPSRPTAFDVWQASWKYLGATSLRDDELPAQGSELGDADKQRLLAQLDSDNWHEVNDAKAELLRYRDREFFIPKLTEVVGKKFESDQYSPVPCLAAEALGTIGPSAHTAIPALIEAMRDDWSLHVRDSGRALVAVSAEAHDALPALEAAWSKSSGERRAVLSFVLWRLTKQRAALDALIETLRVSEQQSNVNDELPLLLLGEIGPAAARATPAIVRALDEQRNSRGEALDALGRIGPAARDAIPTLVRLISTYDDESVRAGEVLRRIALNTHVQQFDTENSKQIIQAVQDLKTEYVTRSQMRDRIELVGLLGPDGAPVAGFLMHTLHASTYEEVQLPTAVALWRIQRSKVALDFLRRNIHNPNCHDDAVAGLRVVGREATIALRDMLRTGDIEVAVEIAPDRRLLTNFLVERLKSDDVPGQLRAERLLLELMLEDDRLWRFAFGH